jgi:hypothetical protein
MYFDGHLKKDLYSDYRVESNYPGICFLIAKILNIVLKMTPEMR